MPVETKESLIDQLYWRYAVKIFDPQKKLTQNQWDTLKQALILSPSSYGLQPYKFIVITNPDLKEALVPLSWNQTQPRDCSHFVVFAGLKKMTEERVSQLISLSAEARGIEASQLEAYKQMMIKDVVKGPRSKWAEGWAARQAYIALGNLMTSAAMMGVDTCPMEGFLPDAYDKELELVDTPYRSLVACAIGFRSEKDKYADIKKVRFPENDLIDSRS